MAHLNDGTLRRMVDDPDTVTAPDREHYASCGECRARHDAMAADAVSAAELLAVPATSFDAGAAYSRMEKTEAPRPRFGFRLPILKASSQRMVLVFASVIAVAAVITASANVSQIFAPKTVKPVPVATIQQFDDSPI